MPINPKELNIEELKNRIKWLEKGLKDIKGWTRNRDSRCCTSNIRWRAYNSR